MRCLCVHSETGIARMPTWWLDTQLAAYEASLSLPRPVMFACLGVYASLFLLIIVLEVLDWRRDRERGCRGKLRWPSLDSLQRLTPRELVLMLHHIDTVGLTYADSVTCATYLSEIRERLRDIECQPLEIFEQHHIGPEAVCTCSRPES